MSYSKFSLPDAVKQFQLTLTDREDLFPAVQDATVSSYLEVVRERLFPLGVAIGSEKARSEFIIAPLLVEVRGQSPTPVSLFSGIDFTVDQTQGLNGFCDFLLSRSEQQFFVDAPVLAIIEAKDENIRGGLGQCAATMAGDVWRFLRLRGKQLAIDREERFLKPVERLLGILREIVSAPPGVP
jgi:hypothetical protein